MRTFLFLFFCTVAGCANLPDKSKVNDTYSVDCSSAAMQELQNSLEAAKKELNEAGKTSNIKLSDAENAKIADAASNVAMYYSMLDIARADCSTK